MIKIVEKSSFTFYVHLPFNTGWKDSGVFLVLIFSQSDWIGKDTPYLSVFSPMGCSCDYLPNKVGYDVWIVLAITCTKHFIHVFNVKKFVLNMKIKNKKMTMKKSSFNKSNDYYLFNLSQKMTACLIFQLISHISRRTYLISI